MAANVRWKILFTLAAISLAACDRGPELPESAGYGPNPTLPEPHPTGAFPYVNIAHAVGWRGVEKPIPAEGLGVDAFVTGLDHPRWLYELPNGDILVAETDAPKSEEGGGGGIRGFIMRFYMHQAGADTPSANRITLLRDADGDGVAEMKETFLENLNSPFGMALVGDQLYVANADSLVRFPYKEGDTRIEAPPEKLVDLPSGRNLHWTKSLVADPVGSRLYVGVGSNSNVAEHGMDEEHNRADILEINPVTGDMRVFASGLRNPVGMDWNPATGDLWVAVNERDELGDNLVPDYMTGVREGAFYGWPYSYFGQNVDERVQPENPELVQQAIKPDYALGSHTASLGLTFITDAALGPFQNGVFIGQHGSWNRNPRVGYRVIFVQFEKGAPVGGPKEVLTGFLNERGEAQGRPVGVIIDKRGGLLVADDVGGVVWRVSAVKQAAN